VWHTHRNKAACPWHKRIGVAVEDERGLALENIKALFE
jgi:hypothetical protein